VSYFFADVFYQTPQPSVLKHLLSNIAQTARQGVLHWPIIAKTSYRRRVERRRTL